MKFLTLNTHSWMEEDAEGKFQTKKEQILKLSMILFASRKLTKK